MLPELGLVALICAGVLALLLATLPAYGLLRQNAAWQQLAPSLAMGQSVFLSISFLCLLWAFVQNDFSVAYVAANSHPNLPLFYRVCAVWGSHEGSMLLWVLILSGWTLTVALRQPVNSTLQTRMLSILGCVSVGFIGFIITTSNPFARIFTLTPPQPQDLNPLLQDIGFIMHPPMLYMGYVGCSVAFAFALAVLWQGSVKVAYWQWLRPFVLLAWAFLSLGITLGSWWAYRELGWGGWWFWDPVENASLLPWLITTALVHSLFVAQKRQQFYLWTLLLAIVAFSLSLLGTFLVRSGVLVSVHAFASDPSRGIYMLVFLAIVVGGSLTVFAWRARQLQHRGSVAWWSRENFLLLNNVLLFVMMLTILLGTLYPLVIDVLGVGKISVGAPYFNKMFIPLMTLLVFAMIIGPHLPWYGLQRRVWAMLGVLGAVSAVGGVIFPWSVFGRLSFGVWLGVTLSLWLLLSTLHYWRRQKNNSSVGMVLAHLGLASILLGVTVTTAYSQQTDVQMAVNDRVQVGPYYLRLLNWQQKAGPNYQSQVGTFQVLKQIKSAVENKKYKVVGQLASEKRFYPSRQTWETDAAIDANLWRDIYVALGEPLDNGAWSVRIYYKPFIRWIWLGGIFMLSGGLCAAWRRRGQKKEKLLRGRRVEVGT